MPVVPLFKNRKGNVAVIRKGMRFNFNSGRYFTTDRREIELLKLLAEFGEQGVYIDPKEPDIDTDAATPMEVLRKKFIKEYLESQGQAMDAGNYQSAPVASSAMNTSSNVLQGNSLAEKVSLDKALGVTTEEPVEGELASKPSPVAATAGPALSALEKLKKGDDGSKDKK